MSTAVVVAPLAALAVGIAAAVRVRQSSAAPAAVAMPSAMPVPADDGIDSLLAVIHEAALLHNTHIILINKRFSSLIGEESAALAGRSLVDLVAPDYGPLVADNIERRLAGRPAPERFEVELADSYGQVTRIELTGTLTVYRGERVILYTAMEMMRQQQSGAQSSPGRAQSALEALGDGLLTTDNKGRVDFMNKACERLLGIAPGSVRGQQFADTVTLLDEGNRQVIVDPIAEFLAMGQKLRAGRRSVLLLRADGTERNVELSVTPLPGQRNEMVGVVVVMHDISELRGVTRQMTYQASHDALTGLVNRQEFERRLQAALSSTKDARQPKVLCFLDLDRFKAVNDTSGHMAGDGMLREVGALLKTVLRETDTVGRLGGDEFGFLLLDCPLEQAVSLCENVSAAVRDYRFIWRDKIFSIGISIGLVDLTGSASTVEDAIAVADSACYVAKSMGQGQVHVYSPEDAPLVRQRAEIQWLQHVQNALTNGRFLLYTQEIQPSGTSDQTGPALEVFVRLIAEDGSIKMPADFLEAAERYRLMSMVDRWVVQTAIAELGRGSIVLGAGQSMTINLSGQTLGDVQFLEFVVECLDRTGVLPAQVCFEVTEAAVVANIEHARRFISVLRGLGCTFALDDFGCGLGSFANLKTLTIDYIKIDGMYMRNLAKDTVNQAMVSAIIQLAHSLHFKVIAEQVEDEASLAAARGMGVDFVQGYAVSRPEALKAVA